MTDLFLEGLPVLGLWVDAESQACRLAPRVPRCSFGFKVYALTTQTCQMRSQGLVQDDQ